MRSIDMIAPLQTAGNRTESFSTAVYVPPER